MSQTPMLEFPDDCLPPEGEFASRDALFKSINAWAETRGYAFTTGKSTKERSGKRTVTYACDRSCRPPRDGLERQRKTSSRGTGCPFSVLAKESLDKGRWTLRHRQDARFSLHNHAPSSHPSAHPSHRKFNEQDTIIFTNLTNAGIAPKDIRTYLRQHSDSSATQKDVYNRIVAVRREMCAGQSSIHALANHLDEEGFWNRMRFDASGRVTAVLFAHPGSLQYLESYPDVLLLDCTYKTNKYGMPLLDMIGVDACQRSFCIAFAFLSGESEEDYCWALERLKSIYETCKTRLPSVILTDRCIACMNAVGLVFPTAHSLLCLWHANKAIFQRCQPSFGVAKQGPSTDETMSLSSTTDKWTDFFRFWHSIVSSPSEEVFKERVSAFEKKYVPDFIDQVAYVQTQWLDSYKERLVKAWVDQHAHFGNVATSRVEGIHALLKAHLRKSTLDLFEAWRSIKHAVLNQLSELRYNQAKQQTRTPLELSGPLYGAVRGWISHEALRKVEEQRKLLDKKSPPPTQTCSGVFTKSWGLPCLHTLKSLMEKHQVLVLEHFHSHWHLRRNGYPTQLLEPLRCTDSVKRQSNIPVQSTRREASAFEAIEASKRPPTCSRCHQVGHTRAGNNCPLRHEELLARLAASSGPAAAAIGNTHTTQSSAFENGPSRLHTPLPAIVQPLIPPEADAHYGDQMTQAASSSISGTNQSEMPENPQVFDTQSPERSSTCPVTMTPLDEQATCTPRYDSPQAIYARYVAARSAWYNAQPPGSIKTNQLYRKAQGLPLRYDKQSYEWCLDYKQMSKNCRTASGVRDWTKEEMMAYLDWDKQEDERVEAKVAAEMRSDPASWKRRGMKHIWRSIEKDVEEQEALYSLSASKDVADEDCIVVKP